MPNPIYAAYQAADPYFNLVRRALGNSVDGDHFFDIVSDDVVYEVLYEFPGWPRTIQGRADLMAQFKGYGDSIELEAADNLISRTTVVSSSSNMKSMGPSLRQVSSTTIGFVQSSRLKTGESRTGGTTWTR
jgi:hypothetical protein